MLESSSSGAPHQEQGVEHSTFQQLKEAGAPEPVGNAIAKVGL